MGIKKTLVLAAVAAVVLPVCVDLPATAAVSGVKRHSAVYQENAKPKKQITAQCPAGTRLVGGGGHVNDHGSGKVMLTQLFPLSFAGDQQLDTYTVAAQVSDASFTGSWSLEAYAICASGEAVPKRLATYQLDTERVPSAFKAGKVGCPQGQRVVSGAASAYSTDPSSAPAGLQLARAAGPLDITRATGRTPQADPRSWGLHTYALCAEPMDDVQVVGEVVDSAEHVISCPAGTKVYGAGGGGSLTDSGRTFLRTVYVDPGLRKVHVAMTAVPVGGMVVQAICVRTP